eukprot:6206534-Karenia_brevis.AAC.1
MPDDIFEDMCEYAKKRPSRRRAWKAAWEVKVAERTSDYSAHVSTVTGPWQFDHTAPHFGMS